MYVWELSPDSCHKGASSPRWDGFVISMTEVGVSILPAACLIISLFFTRQIYSVPHGQDLLHLHDIFILKGSVDRGRSCHALCLVHSNVSTLTYRYYAHAIFKSLSCYFCPLWWCGTLTGVDRAAVALGLVVGARTAVGGAAVAPLRDTTGPGILTQYTLYSCTTVTLQQQIKHTFTKVGKITGVLWCNYSSFTHLYHKTLICGSDSNHVNYFCWITIQWLCLCIYVGSKLKCDAYSQKTDSLWRVLWSYPHSLNVSLLCACPVAHPRSLQMTTHTQKERAH